MCGIYPFNPAAIKLKETEDRGSSSETRGTADTTSTATNNGDNTRGPVVLPLVSFREEQEALFARRFEGGYDIYIGED